MSAIGPDNPKKPNLFDNASFLSKMFYCWGAPLLVEGNKRELSEDDVCEPMDEQRSRHCEEIMSKAWEDELKKCKLSGAKPQLARAVVRLFGPSYALICLVVIMIETIPFVQVYFLYDILEYYSRPVDSRVFTDALWDVAGIIFCSWIKGFFSHFYTIRSSFIGMSIRLAVNTLLYQKVLRLSKARKSNISTGFIINLIAIDGKKLEMFVHYSIYLVSAPVQLLATSVAMWFVVGWPAIPGAVFSILCLPLQLWLSKKCSISRHEVIKKADIRIRLMNEIISGIQVLKMYAWENPFAELISSARKEELKCLKKAMRYRTASAMSFVYRSRTGIFLILLSYVLSIGDIDSVTVYVTMVLLNIFQVPVKLMTKGSIFLGESLISLKRMTEFLLIDEDGDRIEDKPGETGEKLIVEPSLQIKHSTAINITGLNTTWSEDAADPVLSDVNLNFDRGQLTAVVGVVGSGKSSLLQAIMGEMHVKKGVVFSSGRISYAAQEPWVFQGSVRDNIVFGQEFDPQRYKRVVGVCALERDIAMFPSGDSTIVGERGVMLSGGQKARVGLARAVYRNADIYLLDDPLSAVDVNVGKSIFDDCIRGVLEGKTVVLVTHQIQVLESVKRIVWLENGTVKTVGSYSDLEGICHDNPSDELEYEKCSFNAEKNEEIENTDSQDAKPSMESEHNMYKSVGGTHWIYFKSGGSYWSIFLMLFIFVFTQLSGSFYDFWQFYWVKLEDHFLQSNASAAYLVRAHNESEGLQIASIRQIDSTSEWCMIILGVILVVLIVSAASEVFYWGHFSTKASQTIHDKMFNAVLRTTMHFFNSNTSGRILNRFSQELSIVDEILSDMMMESMLTGLFVIGSLVMVVIADPFMVATIAVCILIIIGIKIFYVRTSAQIKKLESASRSPVIAHVNQTINGLTTIRAFGAQKFLTSEFHKHQDYNGGAQFLFIGLTRTFGFFVECVGMVYTGVVVASFLAIDTGAANVGIAVFQVLSLSNLLQFFMRLMVDLENALASVERTAQYANLPSEENWRQEGNEIGCTWPEEGKLSFVNASFRYHKDGPKVLENLNFTVMPREKIGIVGRTGAGKSSLISALFRLAEVEGRIEIDDVDTSTVSLHTLRSRISIIPQDPVLFSGTLRKNIDPFDEYTDDKLWTALEEVELKEVISNLPNRLEYVISEGGGNLSVGQKQLVCLARAIVRDNKILVLDEATANVDHQTDALIQKTIRRKFSDNTVLTVAHRLNTVMDSDKILVISNGNAVEFDHPHVLLQNEIGHLKEMVAKYGKTTENILRATAEENYKRKNEEGR